MADIELVIKIDEKIYNDLKSLPFTTFSEDIIKNGIPLEQHEFNLFKELREEIAKEAELAYADFDEYKESVLETESDDLPDDDFRYGMERCMVIINNTIKHLKKEGMT